MAGSAPRAGRSRMHPGNHHGRIVFDGDLTELSAWVASYKELGVTLADGGVDLTRYGEVREGDGDRVVLRTPKERTAAVTAALLAEHTVLDLTVEDLLNVVQFAISILLGLIVIYGFLLALSTTTFWIIRADRFIEMFEGLLEAARWPVGIYPNWMRIGLTAIVPVGFAVTVPAEGLTGQLTWVTLAAACGLAALLLVVSRLLWRSGLHHYSGASS